MLGQLCKLWSELKNRYRMKCWAAQVERIVRRPAGSDEGFTQADIERNSSVSFEIFSTWEILCEEVLDTAHPCVYFECARSELSKRGISDGEYQAMRRLAWRTAGWLNFEMMLWEWVSLDGSDIYWALEWQLTEGSISKAEHRRFLELVDKYATLEERSRKEG